MVSRICPCASYVSMINYNFAMIESSEAPYGIGGIGATGCGTDVGGVKKEWEENVKIDAQIWSGKFIP